MAAGSGNSGLCESATDDTILPELVQLQRMGCPADVIMIILSILRVDANSDATPSPVELGLEYMQLCVVVEELNCTCAASEPIPPSTDPSIPPPEPPECSCDYEFVRLEEYSTVTDILSYLSVVATDEPLAAAVLQQRGEAAAAAHCDKTPADDKATAVFQPKTYTDAQMLAAIQRCGITKPKDAMGVLDLHLDGAFIEYLSELSRQSGYSNDAYIGRYPVPALGGITCPFGWRIHPITHKPNFHRGIDIATYWHTAIASIAPGKVVERGTDTYDGRYVLIEHYDGGFFSYYGHLSDWKVGVGDTVTAGQTIGIEGGDPTDPEPGYSTGHHLHFEIRMTKTGAQVNPLCYLKQPSAKGDDNG